MASPDRPSARRDAIVERSFEEAAALVRASPIDRESPVPDAVRLKLYGYYKVATSPSRATNTPRPSLFDPVGRAKHDAWAECEKECGGDGIAGMRRYVEVAGGCRTEVGRRCGQIWEEMQRRVDDLGRETEEGGDGTEEIPLNSADSGGKEGAFALKHRPSCAIPLANVSCIGLKPASAPKGWIQSLLPPPLLPRGQLDISFLDLLYALSQCLLHIIYTFFLGPGGIIHRMLSFLLPQFVMAVVDAALGKYHPQRRGRHFEGEVERMWLEGTAADTATPTEKDSAGKESTQIVVGLSVRSLLDLYLTSRSHPAGSEVIVVPAVSIPGMVDVMRYHDLTLVPVDLPCDPNATKTDTSMEEKELHKYTRWGVDLPAVKAAVTERTVAILVVHPFGTIVANAAIMQEMRTIADEDGLEIWEDCAQCYAGLPSGAPLKIKAEEEGSSVRLGYTGSEFADISFFSFGPIKTATALGGGVAVIRQTNRSGGDTNSDEIAERARTMRRVQDFLYEPQANSSYLARVVKSMGIQCTSHSRLLCGLARVLLEALGWNFDDFVVSLTRGFSTSPVDTDRKQPLKKGSLASGEDDQRRKELMQQLRRQPCAALLALLYRRLADSKRTRKSVQRRLDWCRALERKLSRANVGGIALPKNSDGSSMYGWLFPILHPDPLRASKMLLNAGFDAPRGATQLVPISCTDKSEGCIGQCPRVCAVFDRILYLPVANPAFSPEDFLMLIKALADSATASSSGVKDSVKGIRMKDRRSFLPRWTFLCIGVFEWLFPVLGLFHNVPARLMLRVASLIGPWVGAVAANVLMLLLALSQYMGPIYLESSNTFAKYCDVLFHSPFGEESTDTYTEEEFAQSETILELDSTKLPSVADGAADANGKDDAQKVLLTGATGFIGSLLLRELLLHRHSLQIPGGVVVVVRSKRRKSARERVDRLLSQSMFEFLSDDDKQSLVHVIDGDVTLPDCGMEEEQLKSLCHWNISHVFHCAAAVSFSQSLEDAAVSNVTSSLQMQLLTKKLRRRDAKFVYISTAFVHGGNTGSKSKPLPEEVFSLHPYNPAELYKSMLGSQSYASAAMNEMGFPNTYTFSKCVCEHLLLANAGGDANTLIIRPSIVGPSVQEPFEGWAGEKPSTIVAAACLYLKFPYNMWCFGENLVPFIPVDVVCRCVISKSFGQSKGSYAGFDSSLDDGEDEKKENSPSDFIEGHCSASPVIATVAWDSSSPDSSSFSWISYAFAITHVGAVCGHVHRVIAYAGLLLSTKLFPWCNFRLDTFQRLHFMLVRSPLDSLLDIWDRLAFKPRAFRDLMALSPVIDLPMLFFPYANQSFCFKSELTAPPDFNGERYMFSCVVAAHRFVERIEQQRNGRSRQQQTNTREYGGGANRRGRKPSRSIVVAGASHVQPTSDLWWALTQPRGGLTIRLAGWILAKIFRRTAMEIEIDVASLKGISRSLSSSLASTPPHIILAPTHRSFYDFLVVSYVCFSLPELGLDMPHIAAASDFAAIPLIGWLARKCNAFFIERSGSKSKRGLKEGLATITGGEPQSRRPAFIEVFIEGTRSRNRTFVKPKTGFLRCLAETLGPRAIVPLTINYEVLPDGASLVQEANGGRRQRMSLAKLSNWMRDVFSGRVNIGRVYLSASDPLVMPALRATEVLAFAHAVQSRHQGRVVASNFHIRAASLALELSEEVVLEALLELGCPIWPESDQNKHLPLTRDDQDFLWSAMLQVGHLFGPYLATAHPMWSSWLSPSFGRVDAKVSQNEAVSAVVSKLTQRFELTEKAVDEVLSDLRSKGYQLPEETHVAQYLPSDSQVPQFVMHVAVKARIDAGDILNGENGKSSGSFGARPLFSSHPSGIIDDRLVPRSHSQTDGSAEAFGSWGYRDSYFVLNVRPDGSKDVLMKGTRYGISGKSLPKLASFVEGELNATINPRDCTFPTCQSLQHLPESGLNTKDIADLTSSLGNDTSRVSTRPVDRARHGTGHAQEEVFALRTGLAEFRLPDAVAWPQNEEEIQSLVSLAGKKNWCLIPFGGGTNVSHSTRCPSRPIDPRPMISVDMKLMNRVRWVNEEDGLVHVEAGITGAELIRRMEKLGFTIGHEPDSYEFSTLGGWIATKASGMKQNKYGNIEDIVKEVNVVGAKATMSHVHKAEKTSVGRSSTGVDLKSLMLGSEGCLGIVVSAVLKIWPIGEAKSHESVILPSFDAGVRFMKELSRMRAMKPASVRLLDNDQFRLGQALRESPSKLQLLRDIASKNISRIVGSFSERSVVCATIAFEGTPEEVNVQKQFVRKLASAHGGILAGSKVGKAGYDLTFAIAYLRDFALNYNILGESFETFAPWSKLTRVIDATKRKIHSEHRSRSLPGAPFVSCRITQLYDDGACIYFYFCMQIGGVERPSSIFSEIEHSARQTILDNGGTLSHHHGLGKLRPAFVPQIYSQGYISTVLTVKAAIDPDNTFGARNGVFAMMKSSDNI
ncbi:hypothetical protein ACHAXT_013119 [Thalassiosira profunda]